jgi:hypothetical protein
VFWIFANHADDTFALDDLAIIAHLLNRGSYLHLNVSYSICGHLNVCVVGRAIAATNPCIIGAGYAKILHAVQGISKKELWSQ